MPRICDTRQVSADRFIQSCR